MKASFFAFIVSILFGCSVGLLRDHPIVRISTFRKSAFTRVFLNANHIQKLDVVSNLLENYTKSLSDSLWLDVQDEATIKDLKERVNQFQLVLKSAKYLKDLEKDIETCKTQLATSNDSTNEKASKFLSEFVAIQEELNSQLCELLQDDCLIDSAEQ